MRVLLVAAVSSAAFAAIGCELIGGFQSFEGTGGTSNGATIGSSTSSSGGAGACPHPPAHMISATLPDGTCFWIDEKEVSQGDYDLFLASTPDSASQDAPCTGEPLDRHCAGDADAGGGPDPGHPAACVSWCSAKFFCETSVSVPGHHKRLCHGKFNAPSDADDEWYAACAFSGNGAYDNVYPYGSTYAPQTCNGAENTLGMHESLPVGAPMSCTSSLGIVDMSGNVTEWADACEDNTNIASPCMARGGSFLSQSDALTCAAFTTPSPRTAKLPSVGFRCCADAVP